MLVQGWLIEILCTLFKEHEGKQFLSRTDSESTVHIINSKRVSSASMAEAFHVVIDNEDRFQVGYRAEHIPTETDKVSDFLSRGKIRKALELAKTTFPEAFIFTIPEDMLQRWEIGEVIVRRAASH